MVAFSGSSAFYSRPEKSPRPSSPDVNPALVKSVESFQKGHDYIGNQELGALSKNNVASTLNSLGAASNRTPNANEVYQTYNYYFQSPDGGLNATNSYIQPGLSGNYVIPHGSLYFDERLSLDYLDRAVKESEGHAFDALTSSNQAGLHSYLGRADLDRAERLGYNVRSGYSNE